MGEIKHIQTRLVMILTVSEDTVILTMGRKWSPSEAHQSAKSADVVHQIQHGRVSLWLITKAPQWQKATLAQKRQLMMESVRRQEAETHAKVASMAKQGQWTNWESL